MRIIVIGAKGDIGQAVCAELGARHELVLAGRSSGDLRVDIADRSSVEAMYANAGAVDAVVCAAGDVHFSPLEDFTSEGFMSTFREKVMGQVNLVLAGLERLLDGGSFTLPAEFLIVSRSERELQLQRRTERWAVS